MNTGTSFEFKFETIKFFLEDSVTFISCRGLSFFV